MSKSQTDEEGNAEQEEERKTNIEGEKKKKKRIWETELSVSGEWSGL